MLDVHTNDGDRPIAIIRVDIEHAEAGKSLQIDFGKQVLEGEVTNLPFYSSR